MNGNVVQFSRREFLNRSYLALPAALATLAFLRSKALADRTTDLRTHEVREAGAKGDGHTLDTSALQKAIDLAGDQGGGTVHFSPGRYLSGTLRLRSGVAIDLDAGAVLLGSNKLEDYPPLPASVRSYTDNYTERSLIYADQIERVTLQGRGIIDGQGAAFKGAYKLRPYLMRFIGCRDILVRDLTLKDSPMWVQHYLACDGVRIDGVTVVSKCNANNDGIDIDGSQRVRITACDIQSGDDAIVLKATLDRPCKHVVITNCVLSSDCNAFKLGTESNGGFENIVLNNCVMYDTRLAGIALEMVDGGILEGVNVSNVTMTNVSCPIFVRLGNRARPFQAGLKRPGPGELRDVIISEVQAVRADRTGCSITGLPDRPVKNITLRNIRLSFAGGVTDSDPQRPVPERPEAYPEYSMFGILPAYGLYCRHVQNLFLENIEANCSADDGRPSLVCDDVAALRLSAWSGSSFTRPRPVACFSDVRDALVDSCRPSQASGTFLRVSGAKTANVRLVGNDLSHISRGVESAPEVPAGAVILGPG